MKPPYKIPTMEEVNALPKRFKVASTFSGAGGSSLGYKMAGLNVVWANEFVPAAQEVYRLNHTNTFLNTMDIRELEPEQLMEEAGVNVGELDVLDGSPPCASFTPAGNVSKDWGKVKSYSSKKQRTDDLFFEYARILKAVQPKTFIAENVPGLVMGKAKGYFKLIIQALADCGYKVQARILQAEYLGVPQARHRLIFQGVRNDINLEHAYPEPLDYVYSVEEALQNVDNSNNPLAPELTVIGIRTFNSIPRGGIYAKRNTVRRLDAKLPSFTIAATACMYHWNEPRLLHIGEVKRVCSFPADFQLTGSFSTQWERLGRAVPPVMMQHIARTVKEQILCEIK